MENLICSLKIIETDFVVSTPHPNCQFLILGKFGDNGEASKIQTLSNDQTCHLCNEGPIVYSTSCTPELANLNQGCAVML